MVLALASGVFVHDARRAVLIVARSVEDAGVVVSAAMGHVGAGIEVVGGAVRRRVAPAVAMVATIATACIMVIVLNNRGRRGNSDVKVDEPSVVGL